MITHRKASDLLSAGDTVYCIKGRNIIPAKVISVESDHLSTDIDLLFFDEHGIFWFLTKKSS